MDDLSDRDLLAALEKRRKRGESAHITPFLLAPLATALSWRSLGPFAAAGLGFGVLVAGLLLVFLVARRLTTSRLDLLAFERGLRVRLSPEAVERLTSEQLKGVDAPRCVLHLQGMDLPQGGMLSVVLRVDDKGAELETRQASFRAPGVQLKRSSLPLEQARPIWESVETQFGFLESADRFPVVDGCPCELVIGFRDRVRRFVCNLSDPDVDRPIVRLGRDLQSLVAPLIDMPRGERS
jgi:hypothetical protein